MRSSSLDRKPVPDDTENEDLLRHLENGVLRITLNRPDAGNSMKPAMRDQIRDWMDGASADATVRCVVITGAGDRAFCTGAALGAGGNELPPKPEGAPDRIVGDVARMIRNGWQRLIAAIQDCEKPVVAAVNGTAAGGGMNLALACDLVIMAEDARLISVFVRRGLAPDAGAAYLITRLVGPQRAKQLFFFGDDVPAHEAYRMGLANTVVPRANFDATVNEWAERLARGPSRAIALAKWLANRSLDSDRVTAFWDEGWAQELNNHSEDFKEGMTAFMERRTPEFKGW
jgi:2-(1,2-epoxy-1,2-dihydrophenyl)acetyl-CoA isomerase